MHWKTPTIISLVLAYLALAPGAMAADPRIRFQRYGVEEGLPSESVGVVHQDHLGYLWVGTASGLARFDGYRFELFRHEVERPGSLPSNDVHTLLEDQRGRLWVGTAAGLSWYDRSLKQFHRVPIALSGEDAKATVHVHCLLEDRENTLWIGTGQGLFRLSLSATELHADEVRPGFVGLLPGDPVLPDPRVYALAEDEHGSLWIGSRAGLFRLATVRNRHRLDHFVYDAEDPTSLHDDEVYSLLVDRHGDLWIGTWGGGGLGRLEAGQLLVDDPEFESFKGPGGDRPGLGAQVVKSLLEDRDGNLWVGTQLGGLRRLSGHKRRRTEPRFHAITHDPLVFSSLPGTGAVALAEDHQGGLWVGTLQGGLGYHVPATAGVTLVQPTPEPGASPRAGRHTALWEAIDGTLWAGTPEGLARIHLPKKPGEPLEIKRYRHDPTDPNSLAADRITSLFEDHRARLWVGTIGGGLDRLEDGPRPRFVHHQGESGLGSRTIFSMFEDASNVLWVGTYRGLYRGQEGDGGEGRFMGYRHERGNPETLSSDIIYSLAEDAEGRLWIGTDHGLDRLEKDRSTLVRQPIVPDLVALQLSLSADGYLWAASDSHGLVRMDVESGEWRSWQRRDGFADDRSHSLAFDEAGRVWATSSNRLHRLDPGTDEIRTFSQRDGFLISPFVASAFHRGQSGEFYLGGVRGLASFQPRTLHQPPLLSPVVLRQLRLSSRPVEVGPEGPLPQAIETLDRLVLRPEDRTFSLEFASLAFHRQELVRYAYRLRGYSDEWIETAADQRQATFTNLSPGTYVFEARARSDVGDWGPRQVRLEIRILPNWYEARWFQALMALGGLVALALGSWFRRRRQRFRQQELQELLDRWEVEREERQRWQELSWTSERLAQQTRNPLTKIRRLAQRLQTSKGMSRKNLEHIGQILDEADDASSHLGELLANAEDSAKH